MRIGNTNVWCLNDEEKVNKNTIRVVTTSNNSPSLTEDKFLKLHNQNCPQYGVDSENLESKHVTLYIDDLSGAFQYNLIWAANLNRNNIKQELNNFLKDSLFGLSPLYDYKVCLVDKNNRVIDMFIFSNGKVNVEKLI